MAFLKYIIYYSFIQQLINKKKERLYSLDKKTNLRPENLPFQDSCNTGSYKQNFVSKIISTSDEPPDGALIQKIQET